MGRLNDKVALITGGARGQGAAEAALFASEGATVYLTDVLVDEGKKTAADIGGTFLEHDVTSPEQWAAVVERIVGDQGGVDVLVNNAGILHWASLGETALDDWNRVVAVNQTGVFLGMQAVSRPMIEQGAGSIVNISSIAGLRSAGTCFAYGATKWAVRGMTKSAAQRARTARRAGELDPSRHHRHPDDGGPAARRHDRAPFPWAAMRAPTRSPSSRSGSPPTTVPTPTAASSSSTAARPPSNEPASTNGV